MPSRSVHGLLAAVLAVAAFGPAAASELNPLTWVRAGPAGAMQYWVDADTVRAERDVVHYRLHGRGTQEASVATSVEAEVGADCARGLRVEFVTTTRWARGVRTRTASEFAPVQAGRREAIELSIACALAGRGGTGTDGLRSLSADVRSILPEARFKWTGTGFAVSRQVLLTNQHVVRDCAHIRVARQGVELPARLLAADAGADLAALAVPEPALEPLELASEVPELGEPVMVLGYPLASILGRDLRVATGIVSAQAGLHGDARSIQISAPVQQGNSGGPVLDATGAVTGVVARKLDSRLGAENVSFAISAGQVRQFLGAYRVEHKVARVRPVPVSAGWTPLVRRAAPAVYLVQCG